MHEVSPALANLAHVSLANLYNDLDDRLAALRRDDSVVRQSRAIVESALGNGQTYYGINTGFGALAGTRIEPGQLDQLQRNLILSHAVGVGDLIPKAISRLMLQLKIHSLGQGFSGISLETFRRLLWFDECELVPAMPSQGSVGASGDLAPLAHMSLPLIGQGCFWNRSGDQTQPAQGLLAERRAAPIDLQAKDGLALINGTQMMCAYAAHVCYRVASLVKLADLIAAMSLEALQGSIKPFDLRIHELRPHPGQYQVAENINLLLQESEILESHRDCGKVQDPYSLRCAPQVHGASRDLLSHSASVVEREINSVTDNPLVFEGGDIISAGNFHGQPVALTVDAAAVALAELASISERRTYLLLEGHDGLPRLLMRETGINSGFMIPQYTAAALVSENKVLAHPASVDSIPTSLGQEDHVSMGSIGATKLYRILQNVEYVLAIEMITATQALDYRLPLKPGKGVRLAYEFIRSVIPHREVDGTFHDDLNRGLQLLQSPQILEFIVAELGPLQ